MQELSVNKRNKVNLERSKQHYMTERILEIRTSENTNTKLDEMLNKIQQRLLDIKNNKKSDSDNLQASSKSSLKSRPLSPASTMALNLSGSSNSIDDFDEMKQIELGLIFQRSSLKANSQQKEYVKDFMNILCDEVNPIQNSKSQELTQNTSSCKTPVQQDLQKARKSRKSMISPEKMKICAEPDFKQRFNDVIQKADAALKNYKQSHATIRSRRSTAIVREE